MLFALFEELRKKWSIAQRNQPEQTAYALSKGGVQEDIIQPHTRRERLSSIDSEIDGLLFPNRLEVSPPKDDTFAAKRVQSIYNPGFIIKKTHNS